MKLLLILFVCVFGLTFFVQGNEKRIGLSADQVAAITAKIKTIYYVSAGNGDDNNAGTDPESPLCSINCAIGKLTTGDVVVIGPGEYYEAVILDVDYTRLLFEGSIVVAPPVGAGDALTIIGNGCYAFGSLSNRQLPRGPIFTMPLR